MRSGKNPSDEKKAKRIEAQQSTRETIRQAEYERVQNRTVKDLFDTWISDGVARQDENAELKASV